MPPPDSEGLDQHYPTVRRYLESLIRDPWLADDLTQETYLRAWKAVQARGPPRKPREWLVTIAGNVARSHYSKLAKRRPVELLDECLPDNVEDPANVAEAQDEYDSVKAVLGYLRPVDQALVEGLYLQDRGCHELAEENGLTYTATKTRLHRAREKLRRYLG